MATSGTTSFNLSIEEMIEEAYQRCGLAVNSGYDLKRARVLCNLIFSEWGNRGVHLWKVELQTAALVYGQAEYTTPQATNDVLEAYVSSSNTTAQNTNDVSLDKISRSAYADLPNKGQIGQPSQYYVDRQTNPKIYLYLTPDLSNYTYLKYYVIKRIQDAGSYTNTPDVPYRFLPCMVSGLAYYLSMKINPKLTEQLRLYYEDELQRALTEDGQRTSVFISPQAYYGNLL
jgi:hypothetical protein